MTAVRQWIVIVLLALALGLVAGCQRTFHGSVSQPNPLMSPTETLRTSEDVTIVTGDMELRLPSTVAQGAQGTGWQSRRYPLRNRASFTVVSRDRLRFHVQVEHKWQEWADISSWDAYLVDDQGRRYEPEEIDGRKPRHIVEAWEYEQRSAIRDRFGNVMAVRRDRHKRRQTLASVSVFRGRGDVVFYSRDIFTPDIKRLTLVIERRSLAFSWTWKFADETTDPLEAEGQIHYLDGPPGGRFQ